MRPCFRHNFAAEIEVATQGNTKHKKLLTISISEFFSMLNNAHEQVRVRRAAMAAKTPNGQPRISAEKNVHENSL